MDLETDPKTNGHHSVAPIALNAWHQELTMIIEEDDDDDNDDKDGDDD